MNIRALFLVPVLASCALAAEDLPAPVLAKFVKIVVDSSGVGKLQCADSSLKGAFESGGISLDGSSLILFCNSPAQAKVIGSGGRLVISSHRDMVPYAAITIVSDGGKPKFLINSALLRKSKVQVGDAILRLGEVH